MQEKGSYGTEISSDWLQVFRDITNATNERTCIFAGIAACGVGHTAPVITTGHREAVAAALVMGNVNSLPLDWVARLSVGGVHLSLFVVKQLPILPPEAYLGEMVPGGETYAEAVARRVLELTYTSTSLRSFANGLGYLGPPFVWDESTRLLLKCELDAIFAHMYELDRSQVEWILDCDPPGISFPTLKRNEERTFSEYRTRRHVLRAFDQLAAGTAPRLTEGCSTAADR